MMKPRNYIYVGVFAMLLMASNIYGQEKLPSDTLLNAKTTSENLPQKPLKNRKNTIAVNVTNPTIISNKFFTFAYERVLTENQTFSISLGSFSIPKFFHVSDSLQLDTDYSDKGFHFSADYRFYLGKVNRYGAPRGVYIGPYYAYNHLKRNMTWHLDGTTFVGDVSHEMNLNIHTIGFELGYQFVFWDRMTVDLILFGPGFGSYKINSVLTTSLTSEQENEFFNKLNEFLEAQLPGYDKVIESGEFIKTGGFQTWEGGYRYSIRVGFRF